MTNNLIDYCREHGPDLICAGGFLIMIALFLWWIIAILADKTPLIKRFETDDAEAIKKDWETVIKK